MRYLAEEMSDQGGNIGGIELYEARRLAVDAFTKPSEPSIGDPITKLARKIHRTEEEREVDTAISNFRLWYERADPGDRYVYYTGFLTRDRGARKAVDALALAAAGHERAGLVLLVQRRRKAASYDYIAIRVARRLK